MQDETRPPVHDAALGVHVVCGEIVIDTRGSGGVSLTARAARDTAALLLAAADELDAKR